MKKSNIIKQVCFAACALTISLSCSSDDEPAKRPITDNNAGEFKVSNLSLFDKQQKGELEAINGDTLKVIFTPKSDYKDIKFELSCDQLKKYNDSLYIVNAAKAGGQQLKLTAKYLNETDNSITTYTAEKDIDITIYSESVTIPYVVSVSKDLLKFVDPEVTYESSDGEKLTFTIKDSDWLKPKNTESENYDYVFNIRYTTMGVMSTVSVKYLKKANVENDKDSYFFHHELDRRSASIKIPGAIYNDIYAPINIRIGPDTRRDAVDSYISELSANPDVFKINVDPQKNSLKRIM